MKRIYLLAPDFQLSRRIVEDLLRAPIEDGQLLVLVGVPRGRVAAIETRVKQHLPTARLKGIEPTVPAFFHHAVAAFHG